MSNAAATASRTCWKKALLRRSQGSIAPSRRQRSASTITRSGSKYMVAPMPSQVGQAPAGLLNETKLGQAHATVGAGEFLREQEIVALEGRDLDQPATQFGGQLDGLGQALLDA